MKEIIPENIMEKRRADRLRRLIFFMSDKTPPNARNVLARAECLNLLEGWFQNSKWATAWFVVKYAVRSDWNSFKINCWFLWQFKVRRRSVEEVEELLAKQ